MGFGMEYRVIEVFTKEEDKKRITGWLKSIDLDWIKKEKDRK